MSQNLKVLGPLRGKFNLFSPSGLEIQSDFFYYRTLKIKLCSARPLKSYRNEKNLMHGRVIATMSKISAHIFETYFNLPNSNKALGGTHLHRVYFMATDTDRLSCNLIG